jgi:hypothetical protein
MLGEMIASSCAEGTDLSGVNSGACDERLKDTWYSVREVDGRLAKRSQEKVLRCHSKTLNRQFVRISDGRAIHVPLPDGAERITASVGAAL